ncbi:MAG TPA: hypothetical protein VHB20_00065 [Verrucomicrobiae bacterium]|nr:hypothetical protein [Verrucomicrobiae bacterium]
MSPYTKALASVIRLVAVGLIIFSVCEYAGDVASRATHQGGGSAAALALQAVPFLGGLILIWKSSSIAEHFTRDLD